MSNAYTGTTELSNLVKTGYDRLVEFGLRAQTVIRNVADKRPSQLTNPGTTITFSFYSDLTAVSAALTEATDPDAVAVSNPSTVSLTLNEYGNAVLQTRKVRLFTISDIDPAIADMVSFNMADSLDTLALTTLRAGTNVIYASGSSTVGVTGSATITSAHVRKAVAKLRAAKAVPRREELWWCGIHPEVSHDLRAETGAGGWRTPHEYNSNGNLWKGEIGQYEGAFFVETPRMYNTTDGASSARVYRTILCGQQALAEAVADEPHIVFGEVTDKLKRFRPVGWYGVLGWSRYREEALYRIETTSSINNS